MKSITKHKRNNRAEDWTKPVRKDNFKNRFRHKRKGESGQKPIIKSIDGTWEGLRSFPSMPHIPIGTICGRCGNKKDNKGKCVSAMTYSKMPDVLYKHFKSQIPKSYLVKTKLGHFCLHENKVYL